MHRFMFVKGGLCTGRRLLVPTFGAIGGLGGRLTDLLSRTPPAGSHLSETLPAARGLEAPGENHTGGSVKPKRGDAIVFAVASRRASVHERR